MAEHGTISRYKYGCTCAACRRANAIRQNQYRMGKRAGRRLIRSDRSRRIARDLCKFHEGETARWSHARLARHVGMSERSLERLMDGSNKFILKETAAALRATPRYQTLTNLVPAAPAREHLHLVSKKSQNGDYWTLAEIAKALDSNLARVKRISAGLVSEIERELEEKILLIPERRQVVGIEDYPEARRHIRFLYTKKGTARGDVENRDYWKMEELAAHLGVTTWTLHHYTIGDRQIDRKLANKILATPRRRLFLQTQNHLTRVAS